jgi:hypothetical protein
MVDKLKAREVAEIYDVPPWLIDKDTPKTTRELWWWRLRHVRRWRRHGLRLIDRALAKIGLMRVSAQPVKNLTISNGRISVTLRNGYRWSGVQDPLGVKKMALADEQAESTQP